MRIITHWLVLAAALAATAWILPGVEVTSVSALLVAALVLGFLNAILKPILVVLTLPITVVTLGIFYFVLNALLFGLASTAGHGLRGARLRRGLPGRAADERALVGHRRDGQEARARTSRREYSRRLIFLVAVFSNSSKVRPIFATAAYFGIMPLRVCAVLLHDGLEGLLVDAVRVGLVEVGVDDGLDAAVVVQHQRFHHVGQVVEARLDLFRVDVLPGAPRGSCSWNDRSGTGTRSASMWPRSPVCSQPSASMVAAVASGSL